MLNRNNIEYELDKILEPLDIKDYELEIDLRTRAPLEPYEILLRANDQVIYKGGLSNGNKTFQTTIHVPEGDLFLNAETQSHINGQQVVVSGLRINKTDVFRSNLWVMDRQIFTHVNGEVEKYCNGLYHDGTWSLSIPTPIFPWIRRERNKLSNVDYFQHSKFDAEAEEYYKLLDRIFR